jgi:hypothetical protein
VWSVKNVKKILTFPLKYYNLRKRFLKLKEENDKNSTYAYRYLEVAGLIGFLNTYIITNDGKVVTIDNCQYIKTFGGRGFSLTHKGNCTNRIHYTK